MGEVYLLESEAINRPQESLVSKPHLVLDEMDEGSKGEDKEPSFPTVPVEVIPGKSDEDEEEKRVAKYTAVIEGLSEEELP